MLQAEQSALKEFASNVHVILPVIKTLLSESFHSKDAVINLSYLQSEPFICLPNKKIKSVVTIQNFVELAIQRWQMEINYQNEILHLKDQIIEEFDKFSSNFKDEHLVNYIKVQNQKIIEELFLLTGFDKKQMAGEFCKGLMNGFEIEMINKIEQYGIYILWTPLATPFPLVIIDFIRETLAAKNIVNNEESIDKATQKILQRIKEHSVEILISNANSNFFGSMKTGLKNIFTKSNSSMTSGELKKMLNTVKAQRNKCIIFIEGWSDSSSIIQDQRMLIDFIEISMDLEVFIKKNIPFCYNSLILTNISNKNSLQKIFPKLPKTLNHLYLDLSSNFGHVNDISKDIALMVENEIKYIKKLVIDLGKKSVNFEHIMPLQSVFTKVGYEIQLKVHELKYSSNFDTTSKDFEFAAKILWHSNTLVKLSFRFNRGEIGVQNLNELTDSFQGLHSITELNLDFAKNAIQDESFQQLAKSIFTMVHLKELLLDFSGGKNKVTDKTIQILASSMQNLQELSKFCLDISDGQHEVTDESFVVLATYMKKCQNISILKIWIKEGKNSISSKFIFELAEAVKLMKVPLHFWLDARGKNHKITINDKDYLKKSTIYSSFIILSSEDINAQLI